MEEGHKVPDIVLYYNIKQIKEFMEDRRLALNGQTLVDFYSYLQEKCPVSDNTSPYVVAVTSELQDGGKLYLDKDFRVFWK